MEISSLKDSPAGFRELSCHVVKGSPIARIWQWFLEAQDNPWSKTRKKARNLVWQPQGTHFAQKHMCTSKIRHLKWEWSPAEMMTSAF